MRPDAQTCGAQTRRTSPSWRPTTIRGILKPVYRMCRSLRQARQARKSSRTLCSATSSMAASFWRFARSGPSTLEFKARADPPDLRSKDGHTSHHKPLETLATATWHSSSRRARALPRLCLVKLSYATSEPRTKDQSTLTRIRRTAILSVHVQYRYEMLYL